MTGSRPRGPQRFDDQAALDFLSHQRWVALCIEDADGELRCTPGLLSDRLETRLHIDLPGGQPEISASDGARAALVADEFLSYEGIRGVIARGFMTYDRTRRIADFQLRKVTGFSFRGGLPSLPATEPDFDTPERNPDQ